MKNSEWGAVAYLTNAVGRIPYINNSNAYITGSSGVEEDSEESSTRYAEENGDSNTEFAWNTENGVRASSTHNIYGVYDLSGGAGEYMATYLEGGTNECMSSLIANTDTKYVDIYPANADLVGYTSSVTGDALYETSSEAYNGNTENGSIQASWDGDGSFAPAQSHPVLTRGGFSVTSPLFGVFFFAGSYGEAVLPLGFRPVLSIQ